MSELERKLTALGAELEWPETPAFSLRLDAAPRAALAVGGGRSWSRSRSSSVAIGIAFAVPPARSAILRLLPPRRRDGRARLDAAARRRSGRSAPSSAAASPTTRRRGSSAAGPAPGHERASRSSTSATGVISAVLATPEPVLVSQLRPLGGGTLLKKVAGMSLDRRGRADRRAAPGHLDRGRGARRLLARGAAAAGRERAALGGRRRDVPHRGQAPHERARARARPRDDRLSRRPPG